MVIAFPQCGTLPRIAGAIFLGIALLAQPAAAAPGTQAIAADPAPNAEAEVDLAKARDALAVGDYARAYTLFVAIAKENSSQAQFTVGMFYRSGWGRPADPVRACMWFEKAAAGDIPAAQHYFAECLAHGIDRPAEPAQAAEWYLRAGENGHLGSYCHMGALYLHGDGVPKDPKRAVSLCLTGAERGSPIAQAMLAGFLLNNPDIQDFSAAHYWAEMSAPYVAEASHMLGRIYRDGVGRDADPQKALAHYESAAARGHAPSYLPLALLYFEALELDREGLPPPAILAKTYLWASAAHRRAGGELARNQTGELLAKITQIMPDSWKEDLDSKIEQHFAEFVVGDTN